jgi:hypothetical protein
MSNFGNILFSGIPFIRWTLLPIFLFCVGGFGLMTFISILDKALIPALVSITFTVACAVMCIAMLFPHCRWAIRIITGMVFFAYLIYLVHEWLFDTSAGIGIGAKRSESTPLNSLLGFVIIGLPCLWYTVFGRFTFRPEPEPNNLSDDFIDRELDNKDDRTKR